MSSFETIWTWVIVIALPLVLGFFWFAQTGGSGLGAAPASEVWRVTSAYFGWAIASAALAALGMIALRFTSKYSLEERGGYHWPRMTKIEGDERDGVIARFCFAGTVGLLFVAWLVCFIRYTDCRIVLAKTGVPVGDGFLSDRFGALTSMNWSLGGAPHWKLHDQTGYEYLPLITDGVPLLLFCIAVGYWGCWGYRSFGVRG